MAARRTALSVALVVLAVCCLLALGCDSSNALDSVTATTSVAAAPTTAAPTTQAPTTQAPTTAPPAAPTTAAPAATQSTAAVSLPNTELLMVGRWVRIGQRWTEYLIFLPLYDDTDFRSGVQRVIDRTGLEPDGQVGIGQYPNDPQQEGGDAVHTFYRADDTTIWILQWEWIPETQSTKDTWVAYAYSIDGDVLTMPEPSTYVADVGPPLSWTHEPWAPSTF